MSDGLLWLTEQDVAALVPLDAVVEELEHWLRDEGSGDARSIPKALATWEDRSSVHALGALSTAHGTACFKTWVNTPRGAAAIVTLFDAVEGCVLAVIEAGTVGFLRTAAINGVATRHLAADDATSMAIVGTGRQALQQVAAVQAVRPLESVSVYSPTREHREAFAARVTAELELDARAAASVEEAVDGQPIVTLITRASEPFVHVGALADGAHVNAAGAILPANAELASDVLRGASLIVADSIENARRASRELTELDRWEEVVALRDVVSGDVSRSDRDGQTVFKGMGMGLSDLAVATLALRRAREQGLGHPIPAAVPATPRWGSRFTSAS